MMNKGLEVIEAFGDLDRLRRFELMEHIAEALALWSRVRRHRGGVGRPSCSEE